MQDGSRLCASALGDPGGELASSARLALSPGHWFGREGAGFARMTLAVPADQVSEAAARLATAAAERRGVDEAVRTAGGRLLEASASNLFWEADGELFTPSDSLPLYPGVTRSVVIQEARRAGWTVHEGEFGPRALESANGAFLTNAVRGLEPIAELDGTPLDWPATLETLRVTVEEARTEAGLPVAGWAGPTDGSR